ITRTSTGPFVDSNRSPSCSWTAVKRDGFGSSAAGGAFPARPAVLNCKLKSIFEHRLKHQSELIRWNSSSFISRGRRLDLVAIAVDPIRSANNLVCQKRGPIRMLVGKLQQPPQRPVGHY